MTQPRFVLAFVALSALVAVPSVFGQSALVRGTVRDGSGDPIPNVEISVTAEDLSSFRKTLATNDKGQFMLRFQSAQIQYRFDFLFEKPGYESFTQPLSPSAVARVEEEFVMEVSEVAVVEHRGDLESIVRGGGNAAVEAFNAGLTAQRQKDLPAALARFDEALAADSELAPAHLARAQVLLDQRLFEEALASASRALELQGSRADALRVQHQALRALGRRDEAEVVGAALDEAEDAVASALRLYNEGGEAFQAGRNEEALTQFLKAAELDPALIDAHHAIATLQMGVGNFEASAAAAEKALALGSDDVRTLRVLYSAYDALGRTAELGEIAPRLAAVDPEFGGAKLVEQAAEAWNTGQTEKAVSLSRLALQVDPGLAKAYYFVGLDHLSKGENSEASTALRRFLELAPEDSEAATAKEMLSYLE